MSSIHSLNYSIPRCSRLRNASNTTAAQCPDSLGSSRNSVTTDFPIPDEEPDTTVRQVADWLEVDERVARRRLTSGAEERDRLTSELADRHLLSEVLIRNRKAVVGGFMPRVATRWEVELTPEETEALQAVEDYVQYGFQLAEGANGTPIGFVMVTFQKLMASSIAAIRTSLGRRWEKVRANGLLHSTTGEELEDRLLNDEEESAVLEPVYNLCGMLS